MTFRTLLLAACLCAGLVACNNEGRDRADDTGTDATTDTGDVTPGDTDFDSFTDGGTDVSPDVGDDTDDDAEPDTTTGLPEPDNHRPVEVTCDDVREPTTNLPDADDPEAWECYSDDDCTEGANGRCRPQPRWGWACTYDDCFEDADCGGSVCGCGADWGSDANACYGGTCQVDADCGDGNWCSPSYGDCGDYSGVVAYYCRTAQDECLNDSDCTESGGGYCMFSEPAGHWLCSYSHCAGK